MIMMTGGGGSVRSFPMYCLAIGILLYHSIVQAFLHHPSPRLASNGINIGRGMTMSSSIQEPSSSSSSSSSSNQEVSPTIPTLDQRTRWQLSLALKGPTMSESLRADLTLRFVERQGYEPPQGYIFVERDSVGLLLVDEKGYADAKWTLSEDKNDRKWGLWIWGLFEEPLYPYIYFSLGLKSPKGPDGEALPWAWIDRQRLDFRFNHARKEGAAVLSDGMMTYKTVEMVQADPLGLGGMVNAGEVKDAGTATIYPLLS